MVVGEGGTEGLEREGAERMVAVCVCVCETSEILELGSSGWRMLMRCSVSINKWLRLYIEMFGRNIIP